MARVATLAALLVAALALAGSTSRAATPSVYSGLGSWLDIYADDYWPDPAGVVAQAKQAGVKTLYLQTSNYRQRVAIRRPYAQGRFIDAAHAAGLRVVAWYLPGFDNPRRDTRRTLAAVRFRSATGQRFDGFALDIESSIVPDIATRNARLLALAAELKRAAPRGYPLGAIIPSPVGMRRHAHYWPGFPYKRLARSFDAFLPMAYFSYYAHTPRAAYTYAHDVMTMIRTRTHVPVHIIGGSSKHIPATTLAGFVRAASQDGATGISLYAFPQTSPANWAVLRTFRGR